MAYIQMDIDKINLFSFRAKTEEDYKIMKALIQMSSEDMSLPAANLFVFNKVGSFIFRHESIGTVLSSARLVDSEIPRKIAVRATITGDLRESIAHVIKNVNDITPYLKTGSIFDDHMF